MGGNDTQRFLGFPTFSIVKPKDGKQMRHYGWHKAGCLHPVIRDGPVSLCSRSKRIVSGSGDNTLKVWDADTGQEIRNLNGRTSAVMSGGL
jgi:WD40 repeat protein